MGERGIDGMRAAEGLSARMRRTYTSLGVGELVAAAVFVGLAVGDVLPVTHTGRGARAFWSGLAPLVLILAQVGGYWLLARSWAGQRPMPSGVARAYRAFRILDPIVLLVGLIGALMWLPTDPNMVVVLGVWTFGLVEYVNYFVVRLSYPVHRWPVMVRQWRTPRLVKDLEAAL